MRRITPIISLAALLAVSCIDKDNDLSYNDFVDMNIDLTVAVGGDSLTVPVGATKAFTLADFDFMKDSGDFLKKDEDGSLKIEFAQDLDFGEMLPSFNSTMNPVSANFSTEISLFEDITPSSAVTIDPISGEQKIFNFTASEISAMKSAAAIASPITLDPLNFTLDIKRNFAAQSTLASSDNLVSVSDVVLSNTSTYEVEVSIPGAASIISAGSAVPTIAIGLNDLVKFDGKSTIDISGSAMTLNAANNYSAKKTGKITNLDNSRIAVSGGKISFNETLSVAGNLNINGVKVPAAGIDNLNNLAVVVTMKVSGMTIASFSVSLKDISADIPVTKEVIDIELGKNITDYVTALDMITFKETTLNLEFDIPKVSFIKNATIKADFTANLPKCFIFNDERIDKNNVLKVSQDVSATATSLGHFTLAKPIQVVGISYDKPITPGMKISEEFTVSGKINVPTATVTVGSGAIQNVTVTSSVATSAITLDKFTGTINYTMDKPEKTTVEIGEIPDFLKGDEISLDFDNPYIDMVYNTSVGLPLNANLSLKPYVGGAVSESNSLAVALNLGGADENGAKEYKYWISKEDDTTAPAGYTHVGAPVANILKTIPEKLDIEYSVQTDKSVKHFITLADKPEVKMNCKVVIPVSLGKNTRIHGASDIAIEGNLDVLDAISKGAILCAKIESTLPLGLELIAKLEDEKNSVTCDPVKINAYAGGSPAISDIRLVIKEGVKLSKLKNVNLDFTVTGVNADKAVAINENASLKASLYVIIPGGFTLDLNELLNKE